MGERIYLNDDWQFTENYSSSLLEPNCDEDQLKAVRLPHTCKETPFNYFDDQIYQMISGYRKTFTAPEEWKGQKVLLTIEGAAHDSEVFLNKTKVGEHHCGYTAFTVDLTDALIYGDSNVLVIKVDSRENLNIPPFGFVVDYMTYGGIYRDIYLDVKGPLYVKDVFVKADIHFEGEVWQRDAIGRPAKLAARIVTNEAADGLMVRQYLRKQGTEEYRWLGHCELQGNTGELKNWAGNVSLWDLDYPELYELKTELIQNGEVLDEKYITLGFRKTEFKEDGFYLNNKKIKIRGLNRHQSYPYVGYAMPESMQKRDADILKKELGVNAVRTSHYPQSHYFVERCDEIGLLVFMEIPGWQHIGDEAWKNQAVQNVRDMVSQYQNHPSIILWGVRINESADDDEFYSRTNEVARKLDDSRPTSGVRMHKKSSLLEDVYAYNDFLHDGKNPGCEKKRDVTPDTGKCYLISEFNGHMYPSKVFDGENHRLQHALRYANVLDAVAAEEDIAGSFGWCMFDYNTHKDFGSGDRICYHGVMDMFRNPKLAADVYASQQDKSMVLSLSSSMDIGEHPGGFWGDIYILTNADSVRMYKNNVLIKEYTRENSPYQNLEHGPILIDDFIGNAIEKDGKYRAAQAKEIKDALNLVARYGLAALPKQAHRSVLKKVPMFSIEPAEAEELYHHYIGSWGEESTTYRFEAIKGGKVVKEIVKKPSTSYHLVAKTDRFTLREKSSYDVAAIRIRMVDENDDLLYFYNSPLLIKAEGAIEVIGPKVISLQGGMGGSYIKTLGKEGTGTVKIQTLQGEEAELNFKVKINNVQKM
ncbi:MAG: glycoside hydrolase family 2 protein [Lachnospiraceae bacterium]|nr:glycoside hydrolase family 2 protein [Lachnospiraceae bacterium]